MFSIKVPCKYLSKLASKERGEDQSLAKSPVPVKFRKSEFKGKILDNGFCDYDVPEDRPYLLKDTRKNERMAKSHCARKHRHSIRPLKEKRWS